MEKIPPEKTMLPLALGPIAPTRAVQDDDYKNQSDLRSTFDLRAQNANRGQGGLHLAKTSSLVTESIKTITVGLPRFRSENNRTTMA